MAPPGARGASHATHATRCGGAERTEHAAASQLLRAVQASMIDEGERAARELQVDLDEEESRARSLGEVDSAEMAADMHEGDEVAEAVRRSLLPDGGAGAPPVARAEPPPPSGGGGDPAATPAAAGSSDGSAAAADRPEHARKGTSASARGGGGGGWLGTCAPASH